VLVAANSSGGVCGKMISPQSIAVATSATNLVGKEGDIFRFSLKHSVLLTAVVGVIVTLQAYVFKWIVPIYEKVAAVLPPAAPAKAAAPITHGGGYLIGTFVVALLITAISVVKGKAVVVTAGRDGIHFH
jgi:lactate permease